jgi:hypothetical protein
MGIRTFPGADIPVSALYTQFPTQFPGHDTIPGTQYEIIGRGMVIS